MTVLSARANISSNLFEFHSYVLLLLDCVGRRGYLFYSDVRRCYKIMGDNVRRL